MELVNNIELRGFITNLGKYNEGCLVGEWIDFPINEDDLKEVFERIEIDGVNYEEYFFTDWECDLDLGLGEYESIDHVNEIAEMINDLSSDDYEKLVAIMEYDTGNALEAIEYLDNYTFYHDTTLEDFAYDMVQEQYFSKETPEIFQTYFDYEAFARDLSFEGYHEVNDGVLVSC